MPRLAVLGALACGIVAADAAFARAGAADSWLSWSSSSNVCGDAGSFAARVEEALGRSPARAAAEAHVSVTARLERAAGPGGPRWVGEVYLRGEDERQLGSRTIDRRDPSCRPLIDALATVTALALADDGILAEQPPEPGEPAEQRLVGSAPPAVDGTRSPAPPTPPAPVPATPPTPEMPAPEEAPPPPRSAPVVASLSGSSPSPPHPPRGWRSGVEGGAKVGVGQLPGLALGAELSAYLRTARGWKFFLALGGWQTQSSRDAQGRGASLQRLAVGLGACPLTMAGGRWDAAACLVGEVGRLSVSGVGDPTFSSQDRLTLDGGIGGELGRRIAGPVSAAVSIRVTAPLFRDRITYTTTDNAVISVFRESPVAAVGVFRLSATF